MPDPITTIDLLHSDAPAAVATPWEETRRVLETAEVFGLVTVRVDGRPHVTPTKIFACARGDQWSQTCYQF